MARFDNGIAWYAIGTLHQRIAFPEGEIKCKWCPHLRADEANGRYFCRQTGSIVYSKEILADDCPIEFTGEVVGKEKKDVSAFRTL